MDQYLDLYEAEGLALQMSHLGHNVGYYRSMAGSQDQILHMWAYPDAAERSRRRAKLNSDPTWLEFVPRAQSMLLLQENTILAPLSSWLA